MITFTVDDKQEQKYKDWVALHQKKCQMRGGTCGDLYFWRFTPTGIGTFILVTCPCGADFHVEDGENF